MADQVRFLSGNEAVAQAVRLCRPRVVAAYPITPQTVVVERLAALAESGELDTEFVHVESEHSALALVMGAAALGVRTFTATSSQGLLYMAEGLWYASGGRIPLVMMNACRALALPWNIYGDQSDAMAVVSSGWIQAWAEDAQEAFDMVVQAYAVAEDEEVRTPVMVNLDGFVLTHTYEAVSVPSQTEVDAFLPPPTFRDGYPGTFDFSQPQSLAVTAGPGDYTVFKYRQHRDLRFAAHRICEVARRFHSQFGRGAVTLVEEYRSSDAAFVVVTLGTLAGTVRDVVDTLRGEGHPVGLVRLRYLRPFPGEELVAALVGAGRPVALQALAVVEKDNAPGQQGVLGGEVKAALYDAASRNQTPFVAPRVWSVTAGLGGQDVTADDLRGVFVTLESGPFPDWGDPAFFLGLGVTDDDHS